MIGHRRDGNGYSKSFWRYILEKFGGCTEPTYDPLWNVWYLGWYDDDLKMHYHVGPATEILGKYLDSPVWAEGEIVDPEGIVEKSKIGSVEDLFYFAWMRRADRDTVRVKKKNSLSKQEAALLEKINRKTEGDEQC
ncbi:MAG: hypothetical protein K5655_07275 [Lachnospiraceae bacterium]|nr:hypothetical protein [Lachnospiraceae bacterium]